MGEAKDWRIKIGGQAALLGVDIGGSRLEVQSRCQFGEGDAPEVQPVLLSGHRHPISIHSQAVHGLIEEMPGPLVPLPTQACLKPQTILPLPIHMCLAALEVVHVMHRSPLEGHEDVVAVGIEKLVAG